MARMIYPGGARARSRQREEGRDHAGGNGMYHCGEEMRHRASGEVGHVPDQPLYANGGRRTADGGRRTEYRKGQDERGNRRRVSAVPDTLRGGSSGRERTRTTKATLRPSPDFSW